MEHLTGFLNYFLSPLSLVSLNGMSHILGALLTSANLFFWFLVLILTRFALPDILLWLVSLFYPGRPFRTERGWPAAQPAGFSRHRRAQRR